MPYRGTTPQKMYVLISIPIDVATYTPFSIRIKNQGTT